MAAPSGRMRLTVEVLPLVAENAHGPHRDLALQAFKGRKFALPVRLDDTFDKVWAQIEQRYKTNYLTPQQAAAFTIKKLQDAYDCDLDLGDTVDAIFEGETDATMRMIKVVPSFVNRDFSVPATSNLHPGYIQKRLREMNDEEQSNKRRRIEQQLETQVELDPARDQPVPTTESEFSGEESTHNTGVNGISGQTRRSQSGGSLVFVQGAQTGRDEFARSVKEESPELGEASAQGRASGEVPPPALKDKPLRRATSRPPSRSAVWTAQETATSHPLEEGSLQEDPIQDATAEQQSPERNPESVVHQSPQATPVEPTQATSHPVNQRKDVYDVPSSPEFLTNLTHSAKMKKTYGRSPRTANSLQKEVDLLNSSRSQTTNTQLNGKNPAQTPVLKKARAFQTPKTDHIESTPQEAAAESRREYRAESKEFGADLTAAFLEDANNTLHNGPYTPAKTDSAKKTKPGSLRTPSRKLLHYTPSNRSNSVQSNGAVHQASTTPSGSAGKKLDPDIQARLDKINQLRQQKKESPKVLRRNSKQSQSAERKSSTNSQSTTNENVKLSVQLEKPRSLPKQSPIPLPANVRNLSPNAFFKKPAPKAQAQNTVRKRSLGRNDTETQADIQPSAPSVSPLISRVEVPDLVTVSATPQPKKRGRGRPPKSSSQALAPSAEPTAKATAKAKATPKPKPISDTPRKRGRPPQASLVDFFQQASNTPELPSKKAKTTNTKDNTTPLPHTDAENAIVITSGESSESSEPESEPLTQDLNLPSNEIRKEPKSHNTAPEVNESRAEASAEAPSTVPDKEVPTEHQQNDAVAENGAEVSRESSIQASLRAENKMGQETETTRPSAAPWTSENWGFASLDGHTSKVSQANDALDMEPSSAPPPQNNATEAQESGVEDDPIAETGSKSRSASAISTRSSPAVARRPARFLSHSPTPVASASDSESGETSASPSKAASPQPAQKHDSESDSDSSSDTDTSETEDDRELPDATLEGHTSKTEVFSTANEMHSSPPVTSVPASTPRVPSTSQLSASQSVRQTPIPVPGNLPQPVRQTSIPVPTNTSKIPGSSQSVSAQAAARRPTARYTGFRTLREQLVDAKTTPVSAQKKAYDPRILNLGKLAAKGKSSPQMGVELEDDDSSDEESSSSSDSD